MPRVIKATAEKYGEKCYMDWDKQDLVIPAAHDIPAHILDLRTECVFTCNFFARSYSLPVTAVARYAMLWPVTGAGIRRPHRCSVIQQI